MQKPKNKYQRCTKRRSGNKHDANNANGAGSEILEGTKLIHS